MWLTGYNDIGATFFKNASPEFVANYTTKQIDDIMAGRVPREPKDWQGDDKSGPGAVVTPDDAKSDVVDTPKGSGPIGGPAGEH